MRPRLSVRAAIEAGRQAGRYPIFLADHADNTGGGSPGDSTEILHTFLELGLQDSLLLYLVDPEAALAAPRASASGGVYASLWEESQPPSKGHQSRARLR